MDKTEGDHCHPDEFPESSFFHIRRKIRGLINSYNDRWLRPLYLDAGLDENRIGRPCEVFYDRLKISYCFGSRSDITAAYL